ncbi:MAG: excinuclease ABC subunit UvrA [Candidatus Eutrophobiaceae bacterium]
MDTIRIRGARTHNLANIDVDIPRNRLIVITGVSGSGKSSLAFDTIYAEGQRRYVESLSAYARQFLSIMEKPDVDHIEGLSPAISIEQKSVSHNPRSTVGTVTEIYDYLRLLYARVGDPQCPKHGISLVAQTVVQMVDQTLALPADGRLMLLSPVIQDRKGEHAQLLEKLRQDGFVRVRVDGKVYELDHVPSLNLRRKHTIEAVVDRFRVKPGMRLRLSESFETALRLSGGMAKIAFMDDLAEQELAFSSNFACSECGYGIPDPEPKMFSFNSPQGACPECDGLGVYEFFDPEKVVSDPSLSLSEGAVRGWDVRNAFYHSMLCDLADHYGFDLNKPFGKLAMKYRKAVLYGSGDEKILFSYADSRFRRKRKTHVFEGIIPNMRRRYMGDKTKQRSEDAHEYITIQSCLECSGSRLNEAARNVFMQGVSLPEVTAMTVAHSKVFLDGLNLPGARGEIAAKILKEVRDRLYFLINVGLDYMALDRGAGTLSGGEAQRIRLASQIGSGLVGVMYVLDEPSIGLHQRDNQRLLSTLMHLRDIGNTVIVVEHDEEAMRMADHILDIGPGAGRHGGRLIAQGSAQNLEQEKASVTGQYLSGERKIPLPAKRRKVDKACMLTIKGAKGNNLKHLDVKIPIGLFTCVCGVSGSGKSTLVNDTLYKTAAQNLHRAISTPTPCTGIEGLEQIKSVIDIDQAPIGRTPRSNPATYTGLFSPIRDLFAEVSEARSRGYRAGRFSFNVRGGRCEACKGEGLLKVEMHFLPDIYVPCDACKGKRYNRETLNILYKEKTISQVLQMTVEEASEFFCAIPSIAHKLRTLEDVGLGYIQLGQNATTLSGGEAQRIKLARELSRRETGSTLYILDEPTTGLHFQDIECLLGVLQRFTERGNTVVVIEHNLDVIKTADWIIDLGPEGGEGGGEIVAEGTPEQVARSTKSHTGRYLKPVLGAAKKGM